MRNWVRKFRGLFAPQLAPDPATAPAAASHSIEYWRPEDARVIERATAPDPWAPPSAPTQATPLAPDVCTTSPPTEVPAPASLSAAAELSRSDILDTGWNVLETASVDGAPAVPAADHAGVVWPTTEASTSHPSPHTILQLPDSPAALPPLSAPPSVLSSDFPDTGWDVSHTYVTRAAPASRCPPADATFDVDLPEYDPDASQRLGSEEWAASTPPESRVRERAAQIAALLEVTSLQEQIAALHWLEDFFGRRPAAATFRAIERLALAGLDLQTLHAMDALRETWEERPEWWGCRVPALGFRYGAAGIRRMVNGATALSWAMAKRICLSRAELPPEDMIDAEWLDEWYALPQDQRAPISFARYVDEKIAHEAARRLHVGFEACAQLDDPGECFDRLGWYRTIYDPDDGPPLSLRMIDATERRVDRGDQARD